MGNCLAERYILSGHVHQDLRQRCGHDVEASHRRCYDKGKELSIVPAADTVVDPDAVVVDCLDAAVA